MRLQLFELNGNMPTLTTKQGLTGKSLVCDNWSQVMMKVTRSHALGNAKFNHDQYMTLIKLDKMNQKHWAICVLSVKYFSQSEDNILVYP